MAPPRLCGDDEVPGAVDPDDYGRAAIAATE
jgi:hypothetical protein